MCACTHIHDTCTHTHTGLSFHSEGNNAKATGPAPGEETFEEIQDRTGASELDILNKKMAFKRGMKPEKKIEEMAPMVKELRYVQNASVHHVFGSGSIGRCFINEDQLREQLKVEVT
eukprot:1159607-Pelagomonas_calceolata.AAC.8